MNGKWSLQLSLVSDRGESFHQAIDADIFAIDEMVVINPPAKDPIGRMLGGDTFDTVIKKMRKRELRKDIMRDECLRLGAKLAEYMEGREGWHGVDRQERIREYEKSRG